MNKREKRKIINSLCYSSLKLGLHYNDTQIIFISKYNGPIIWVDDLYRHQLIIFITLSLACSSMIYMPH
jgi:hypothetical protein